MKTTFTQLMLASAFVLTAATGLQAQSTMNINTDTDKNNKTTVHIRKVERINGVEKITDTTFTADGNTTINGSDMLTIDETGIEDGLKNITITDDAGERTVTNGTTKITISGDDAIHIDEKKIDDMVQKMVVVKNDKNGITAEVNIDEGEIEKLVSAALAEAGIDTSGKGPHKTITISTSDKATRKAGEKEQKAVNKTMVIRMDVKTDAKAGEGRSTTNASASGSASASGTSNLSNTLAVEDLNFWPNPTDGKFKLRFTLKDKADAMLTIYDTFGKQVYSESLPRFRGEYNKNIDISGNEKGVYFVRIEQGGQALVKKIVLQ